MILDLGCGVGGKTLQLAELPGVTRRIMVCLGDRRLRHENGVEVPPFTGFLHELEKGL